MHVLCVSAAAALAGTLPPLPDATHAASTSGEASVSDAEKMYAACTRTATSATTNFTRVAAEEDIVRAVARRDCVSAGTPM